MLATLAVVVYGMAGFFLATYMPYGIAIGGIFARCTTNAGWPLVGALANAATRLWLQREPYWPVAIVLTTTAVGSLLAFRTARNDMPEVLVERYFLRVPAGLAAIAAILTATGAAFAYHIAGSHTASIHVGACSM